MNMLRMAQRPPTPMGILMALRQASWCSMELLSGTLGTHNRAAKQSDGTKYRRAVSELNSFGVVIRDSESSDM